MNTRTFSHKIGLITLATLSALSNGCGTSVAQHAQAPVSHQTPVVLTDTSTDPSDPTSWVHFTVTPNEARPVRADIVTSASRRNTLCAGATEDKGTRCDMAPQYEFVAAR